MTGILVAKLHIVSTMPKVDHRNKVSPRSIPTIN